VVGGTDACGGQHRPPDATRPRAAEMDRNRDRTAHVPAVCRPVRGVRPLDDQTTARRAVSEFRRGPRRRLAQSGRTGVDRPDGRGRRRGDGAAVRARSDVLGLRRLRLRARRAGDDDARGAGTDRRRPLSRADGVRTRRVSRPADSRWPVCGQCHADDARPHARRLRRHRHCLRVRSRSPRLPRRGPGDSTDRSRRRGQEHARRRRRRRRA